jgi:hypothetical protein
MRADHNHLRPVELPTFCGTPHILANATKIPRLFANALTAGPPGSSRMFAHSHYPLWKSFPETVVNRKDWMNWAASCTFAHACVPYPLVAAFGGGIGEGIRLLVKDK